METRKNNCIYYVTGMLENEDGSKFCSQGGFTKEGLESVGVPYSNICTMNRKQLEEYLRKDDTPIVDFFDMMDEVHEADFEHLTVFFYKTVNHKRRLSHVLNLYRDDDGISHFFTSGRFGYMLDMFKHTNFESPYVLTILNESEIIDPLPVYVEHKPDKIKPEAIDADYKPVE